MVVNRITVNKSSGSNEWALKVAFTTYYQPETELTFAEVVIPDEPSPQSQDPAEDEGS